MGTRKKHDRPTLPAIRKRTHTSKDIKVTKADEPEFGSLTEGGIIRNWWKRKKIKGRGKLEEAAFNVGRTREETLTFIEQEYGLRERVHIELEMLQHQTDQQKWITEQEKEKAKFLKARNRLANKIIKQIDIKDLNMTQVMVIIEMVKDATQETDLAMADARLKKAMAEADKIKAEAEYKDEEVKMKKVIRKDTEKQSKDIYEE